MRRARRGGAGNGLDAWPGYVDALSTLLMVIIFVLLVFVLAQAFLSVALTRRDQALERLNQQMAELSDMLALERGRSQEMRLSVAGLTHDLQAANAGRDALAQQMAGLRADNAGTQAERDALRTDRDRLAAQLADASAQAQSAAQRAATLQAQLGDAAGRTDAAGQQAAQQAAHLAEQVRALTALRDELEKQVRDAAARSSADAATTAAQLAEEHRLGDSARAQVALLNQQMAELRAQLASVSQALDLAQTTGRDKDLQIANLGQKLNTALAAKVEELQRYRSEFFGRLRQVLAGRPGVQIVGDRFVFQSEVLFPAGSAELSPAGQEQVRTLAATIKQIAAEIPAGLGWILRVDGHADRTPVTTGAFASNWELSSQRAINVVKLLSASGVPPSHLAATGFADNQPLEAGETPDAYAKNRRIELRLTDR